MVISNEVKNFRFLIMYTFLMYQSWIKEIKFDVIGFFGTYRLGIFYAISGNLFLFIL